MRGRFCCYRTRQAHAADPRMWRRRLLIALLVAVVVAGLGGCQVSKTPATPPHMGAFLYVDGEFAEMPSVKGSDVDAESLPRYEGARPTIWLWHDNVNLNLLIIEKVGGGGAIPYSASRNEQGIYALEVTQDLDPGTYCLTQGDPMLPSALLPSWCFRVGAVQVADAIPAPEGAKGADAEASQVDDLLDAADQTFRNWAETSSVPYTDVEMHVASNDGTFATVEILAFLRPRASEGWRQHVAFLECRRVSDRWQCDRGLQFQLSSAEVARMEEQASGTATAAAQQLEHATATEVAASAAATAEAVDLALSQMYEQYADAQVAGDTYLQAYWLRAITEVNPRYRDAAQLLDEMDQDFGRLVLFSGQTAYFASAFGDPIEQYFVGSSEAAITQDGERIARVVASPEGPVIEVGPPSGPYLPIGLDLEKRVEFEFQRRYYDELSRTEIRALAWSGNGTELAAFFYFPGGVPDFLYAIDVATGRARILAEEGGTVYDLAWAPANDKLVWSQGFGVRAIGIHGDEIVEVGDVGACNPGWSYYASHCGIHPDGTAFACYVDPPSGDCKLMMFDLARSQRSWLDIDASSVAFSPNGAKIAFVNQTGVYVADSDGDNVVSLGSLGAPDIEVSVRIAWVQ